MEYTEIIREAAGTLAVNKMRTFLATLGIVIGIGSVITLLSLGQSTQKSVQSSIQSIGSNLLTVMPGAVSSGGIRGQAGGRDTLSRDDADAILTSPKVTTVSRVSPEFQSRSQVIAGRNNTNTTIIGVTDAYSIVRKVSAASGRFISEFDVQSMAKVAVLGPQVVTDLFGEGANPVGKMVRIEGHAFTVIGVTASKGGSGFMNQDDQIFVPLTTAQRQLYGADYVTTISVEAKDESVMTQAQDQIGYLLLERHKLKNPEDADFMIMSQSDILSAASTVTGTFTALLSGIAAISLVVGGIGIMNIMLVTVTERTREIGLRKALGAKKRMIVMQFLIESVILTFVGGVVGMVLGIAASYGISRLMGSPFTISAQSLALAIGVSGAIGILFGWYPARRASQLQPIEALRYE